MRVVYVGGLILGVASVVGCGGGGSSTPNDSGGSHVSDPATGTFDAASVLVTVGDPCPADTALCASLATCCPNGTTCVPNPGDTFGCGTADCCVGCLGGSACGAGCCASGTSCVGSSADASCAGGLCCRDDDVSEDCPAWVASECPPGTRCLTNHSARACPDVYACYLPTGQIACPGEETCPNGIDFCPGDTTCTSVGGICPVSSTSGNYCCVHYAQGGESCDVDTCAPDLSCVANNYCPTSDSSATNVCHGACGGDYPVDCGNYCCSASFPVCDGNCWCLEF
ncbi:MAG: hypothetical protein AAB426_03920 [Myxococcota bacterium]